MSLPTTLELLGAEWASEEGVWVVHFEAAHPGETFCRSVVRVFPAAMAGRRLPGGLCSPGNGTVEIDEVVALARDRLLEVLEREGRPVSLVVAVTGEGLRVLERGYPE